MKRLSIAGGVLALCFTLSAFAGETTKIDDELRAAEKRLQQLEKEFDGAPEVKLRGVVAALGAGGTRSPGEELWTLILSLDAWKVGKGPLETTSLTVRKAVTERELDEYRAALPSYAVVELRVRLVRNSVFGTPEARLVKIVGPSNDRELRRVAAELQQPVHRSDSLLGTFTLDRALDQFDATTEWEKRRVTLSVPRDNFDGALETAHALWSESGQWDARLRAFAAEKLLALKNEVWLDDDESELTAAEFVKRLELQNIVIEDDGSFTFWFGDGGLFAGHSITVRGTLGDGLTDANIEG